jgi:acyl-CoA thioesterase I
MNASPLTYVALGDSTGVGVGARRGGGYPDRLVARLARAGHRLRLVNLCVSGAKVADLREEQLERGLASAPSLATLGIGINDVTWGTDPDAFARDYDRVAAALAGTAARVVAVNVPDLSIAPLPVSDDMRRVVHERILRVNGIIAAAAARHGVALVDLHGATEAELAQTRDLLSDDGFHPSDRGYERWTDLMQPAVERALAEVAAGLSGGTALR